MEYQRLEAIVGPDWATFLKGFMCPDETGHCRFDEIAARLRDAVAVRDPLVVPDLSLIWEPFRKTPLKDVRVVFLSNEPYCISALRPGGTAFEGDHTTLYPKLNKTLKALYDAVEQDVYNGMDFTKPTRTGLPGRPNGEGVVEFPWYSQGVLMLNSAFTVLENQPGSHRKLWEPFIIYIIEELQKLFRNLIFVPFGVESKGLMDYRKMTSDVYIGVNIFQHFYLPVRHPQEAIREQQQFTTDVFSRINLLLRIHNLGNQIHW